MKKFYKMSVVIMCLLLILGIFAGCGNKQGSNTIRTYPKKTIFFEPVEEEGVVVFKNTLPIGTKFDVTVTLAGTVETQEFTTENIELGSGAKGIKLSGVETEDGIYRFCITMKKPSEQTDEVREIIGEKGEKIKSADLFTEDDEQFLKKYFNLNCKSGIFNND
ncbi:MAG: hypothetical protein II306_06625 [Clostridia bacterium]|nr:hypothetical protein [Clostridia bacterium]